jgi:DNA-binding NarL/FixJ family response regulator
MEVCLLSSDLFYASQLQGIVQRLGLNLAQVATPADLLSRRAAANAGSDVVLIDLSTSDLDLDDLVSKLREGHSEPKAILAYAPHVATAKLDAARKAGCDRVLTRGQAQREIGDILSEYQSSL